jgi:hypothetical protein
MKKRDTDPHDQIISIRFTRSEAERFWQLMAKIKERAPYTLKTDIAREVFGLNPPLMLTPKEIEFVRTGNLPTRTTLVKTDMVSMQVEAKPIGGKPARAKVRKRA